jgi:tRNA threonylcarbamoyladenosine biosynthesis protein TsaE
MSTHLLPTPADTRALGVRLAGLLAAGDIVVLAGPLGAGKTVLAAGIGAGLGVDGPVVSPTFVIARMHEGGRVPMVHVDAYRLGGSLGAIDDLDLDASLDSSVTVVEWGEGLVERLADSWLLVRLDRSASDDATGDSSAETRTAEITVAGPRWEARADALAAALADAPADPPPDRAGLGARD